ncbi:MAG: Uma2 family endonuclease [Phenylobacterium sp.]|jgi:Uma2 family endonuclease
MLPQTKTEMTSEQYLAAERISEVKHEFFDGAIFAMAGASKTHNLISSNLVRIIGNALLNKPCSVYASDMRVKSEGANKYCYPDVVATCQDEKFEDEKEDTLLNPLLIIEILSDSTEGYDRGDKFFHYRQIGSFVEYILISQKNSHVERYIRQPDNTWLYCEFKSIDDHIELSSIDATIELKDIYHKVKINTDR